MNELAINGGRLVRTSPWPRYPVFGDKEKEAVNEVLDTNWLVAHHNPSGAGQVEAFEDAFAAWIGTPHAVGLGNGTQALHLALAAAGVGVNHEVIVPTLTFMATATAVMMQNAVPVFADSEPDTLGLDPKSVEARITSRTRAVIPVCLCGYPMDMDGLMTVARKHDLVVIEDCSHAHGAVYHSRNIGTIGDMGIFSLQQKKNLCTGDGGMLVTGNPDYAQAVRQMRTFGHNELSYNYRMTETAAAIGQVRLSELDSFNEIRRKNAAIMKTELEGIHGIRVREPVQDTVGVYYSLLMEYDPEILGDVRNEFVAAVKAEGIPLAPSYAPVHRHPNFHPDTSPARGCPWLWPLYDAPENEHPSYDDGVCPVAEDYADRRLVELKVHPPACEEDMVQAAEAIRKVVKNMHKLEEQKV